MCPRTTRRQTLEFGGQTLEFGGQTLEFGGQTSEFSGQAECRRLVGNDCRWYVSQNNTQTDSRVWWTDSRVWWTDSRVWWTSSVQKVDGWWLFLCVQSWYLLLVALSLIARTYADVWMIQNGTAIERWGEVCVIVCVNINVCVWMHTCVCLYICGVCVCACVHVCVCARACVRVCVCVCVCVSLNMFVLCVCWGMGSRFWTCCSNSNYDANGDDAIFFQQCHHWERLCSVQESPLQVHLRHACSECLTLSCPFGWWGEGGREALSLQW